MTELTLKLIIILIPGTLGTIILDRLTIHKDWTPFTFVINAIITGLFAYLLFQLSDNLITLIANAFFFKIKHEYATLEVWNLLSESKKIPYKEILWASLFGIILGFIGLYIDRHKVINRIGQKLKVSNKYGDENLFSYFLNAKETQVVYIRHIKNNLTYYGYVHSYSENENVSEVVLSNVKVYSYSDSEFLYEVDQIYLSFNKTDIIIEHAKFINNVEERQSSEPQTST